MVKLTWLHQMLFAWACLLIACPTAQAMMIGTESNGELVNSNITPEMQIASLDRMKDHGVQVIRVNWGWNEVAQGCAGYAPQELEDDKAPCYTWQLLDNLMRESSRRNMVILFSASRVPYWLHETSDVHYVGTTPAQYRRSFEHYAAFMTAVASRYDRQSPYGHLRMMTIWNEPNSNHFFSPRASAHRYAQMYAQAATSIKQVRPDIMLAPGPTGPNSSIKPVAFIRTFQRALPQYAMPWPAESLIDAWAHNPYPGKNRPPHQLGRLRAPSIVLHNLYELPRVLDRSPITRGIDIWATESSYESPPDPVHGSTLANHTRFLAETFDWYERVSRRIKVGIWYGFTDPYDLADWQSGLYRADGSAKPASAMFKRMVSVPYDRALIGARVRVWGRANVAPRRGELVYRTSRRGAWHRVPGQRRANNGSLLGIMKVAKRRTWFATRTGRIVGPSRLVVAKRR